MIRISIIFFFFSLLSGGVKAQGCSEHLQGLVVDEEGLPAPNAALALQNTRFRSVSDTDGKFRFDGLCAGQYILEVTFIGYETQQVHVTIPAHELVKVTLVPATTLPNAVVQYQYALTVKPINYRFEN